MINALQHRISIIEEDNNYLQIEYEVIKAKIVEHEEGKVTLNLERQSWIKKRVEEEVTVEFPQAKEVEVKKSRQEQSWTKERLDLTQSKKKSKWKSKNNSWDGWR